MAKAKKKLEIVYMPIDDLIPYTNNARKNEAAVPDVKASIVNFGFRVPVCVDKDNVLVYGHTRVLAAKELLAEGSPDFEYLKELPVVRADDLTPAQIKAFRLADNKVAEKAGWDFEKLEKELEDITIDMTQFGFALEDLPDMDSFFGDDDGGGKTKEKKKVKTICPECGKEIEVEV